jgi:hypothetical protein
MRAAHPVSQDIVRDIILKDRLKAIVAREATV